MIVRYHLTFCNYSSILHYLFKLFLLFGVLGLIEEDVRVPLVGIYFFLSIGNIMDLLSISFLLNTQMS